MQSVPIVCAFILILKCCVTGKCPESDGSFRRVGETRFFIIHPSKRGEFLTVEEARSACTKRGLKMPTVKNLLTMAVLGRPLEKLVFDEKLMDTWYWLDGKYDEAKKKYVWGGSEELKFTLFLYRDPRPIGIGRHINYNNIYQPDVDKPQCLTFSLPHPKLENPDQAKVFYGHETTFDERDCKSKQKRHAICESDDKDCTSSLTTPYTIDEGKESYFYEGNWIFGSRTYVVNWKQRNLKESQEYCTSLGLVMLTAGQSDQHLSPYIKMWSRGITVAQFWTSMKYNTDTKQLLDEEGKVVPKELMGSNITATFAKAKSKNVDTILCVVLSVSFEFIEQMPCSNPSSPKCQWSFFRYVPANCNNYHGSICQHKDRTTRTITWTSENKKDLTDVLQTTAVTSEFGYMGNNKVLRSKYKQTFGLFYCPEGYRILRSMKNLYISWSLKPPTTTEFYEYDYIETFWVLDEEMYEKTEDSTCTIFNVKTRKFETAKCVDWHFYLCMKLDRRPSKKREVEVNVAPPMEWKPGPQPRVYPILNGSVELEKCRIFDGDPCECKNPNNTVAPCEYNTVLNHCVEIWKVCPSKHFSNGFCQRQGLHIFYSISGIICNSEESNTNCGIDKTLYSANFGESKSASAGTDSRNITYRYYGGKSQFEDPSNSIHDRTAEIKATSVLPKDEFLYVGYMFGRSHDVKDRPVYCQSLTLDLVGDGNYEFSIKTGKIAHDRTRFFSIQINDQYIVDELDLKMYRPFSSAVELNVNLKISQSETMVEIQGHPVKKLLEAKKIKFVPCTSKCGWTYDPNWLISALSVVKFVQ